ncbi:MAG TPA: secondary thiamine-phosphate synthase enzyme YjbQ [Bacteroidales bacterium]|nr:secondary thiamine-phosphate synthase enzyme YjbQ [Bacteroidales bacterium]HOH84158.1 secondary thiamine-phosphate synthase enzyme YjbQ [Bacteroidales bacterium]HPB26198.1 secondary thiamine-phosphate synthase enzyme YjbQ [Bacteroidales bacterium]HPI30568.1 secondary thiamine-phosphate synthase enzyme YjbQ [Bacteroidales bacterium]HQN15501.1 secondary thiamine-phosphate synthase enzyme YjbQ [Bacteroidales bacterium]
MIYQTEIILPSFGRGFHLITGIIKQNLPPLPETGLVNIFIRHTSAGLTINENFDPTVRLDMSTAFDRIVPENTTLYQHNDEGSDDMPAHVKSSLAGASLSIPIRNHSLGLGTWQGIFLCEFRSKKQQRTVLITIIGE